MKRRGTRGAVLVETALVVGVILTIFLFSLQVGVLGFLQLTVDAASYMDAHLVSVGVNTSASMTPQKATSLIFPQISPAQIVSTVAPAPSPSVPIDYGYNSTDSTVQGAMGSSLTHRNGGVSMLEPTLETATVTKPNMLSLFHKSVGVTGESTDALWLECGIHANVSNSNAGCSPGAASTFQGNYFTTGEHAPPYFVGFDFLHHCNDAQPWGSACSSTGINFLALGTAEFLHAAVGSQQGDWFFSNPGVGGAVNQSVFSFVGCHQRAYAIIAATLQNYPTLYGYYQAPSVWAAQNGYAGYGYNGNAATNGAAIWYQMYNYTNPATQNLYPYLPNNSPLRGFNNFLTGPAGVSTTVIDWDNATDNAVHEIYSWDGVVALGATPGGSLGVGSNPTYPDKNCP